MGRISTVVESDITECLTLNIQCGFPWWLRALSQPSMAAQWWCGQAAGTPDCHMWPAGGCVAGVGSDWFGQTTETYKIKQLDVVKLYQTSKRNHE